MTQGDGLFLPGGKESKHKVAALAPVDQALLVDEESSVQDKNAVPSLFRGLLQKTVPG